MTLSVIVERKADIPAAVATARTLPAWDGEKVVPVQHAEPYTVRRSALGFWVVEWEARA